MTSEIFTMHRDIGDAHVEPGVFRSARASHQHTFHSLGKLYLETRFEELKKRISFGSNHMKILLFISCDLRKSFAPLASFGDVGMAVISTFHHKKVSKQISLLTSRRMLSLDLPGSPEESRQLDPWRMCRRTSRRTNDGADHDDMFILHFKAGVTFPGYDVV